MTPDRLEEEFPEYQSEKDERLEAEYYEDKSLREREDRAEQLMQKAIPPIEEASELIVNYQLQCKSLDYQQAKQCSLIAVNEILRVAFYANDELFNYYMEVKFELEKL